MNRQVRQERQGRREKGKWQSANTDITRLAGFGICDFPLPAGLGFGVWDFPHRVRVISRSERALCFSKYVSVFVWTYADLCRDRRRHARRHVYRELCRAPCPALNPKSLAKPFTKSYKKSNASLFASFSRFKYRMLKALMNGELHGQT